MNADETMGLQLRYPLTEIPRTTSRDLDIARHQLRHLCVGVLLVHWPINLDVCTCGTVTGTHGRTPHIAHELAAVTGLTRRYVLDLLELHSSSLEASSGDKTHCRCGIAHDDDYNTYGWQRHLADALAANSREDSPAVQRYLHPRSNNTDRGAE